MGARSDIQTALESGQPLRIHARDGEVIVARVLDCESEGGVFKVETSSNPERYAFCDSTGLRLRYEEIERVQLLRDI